MKTNYYIPFQKVCITLILLLDLTTFYILASLENSLTPGNFFFKEIQKCNNLNLFHLKYETKNETMRSL